MRRWIILCPVFGVFLCGLLRDSHAQSPTGTPPKADPAREGQVKDRDGVRRSAAEKRWSGDLPGAVADAQAALGIDRAVFGKESGEAADGMSLLAALFERQEKWEAAAKAREEVLAIQIGLHGQAHWQVTDARLALAWQVAPQAHGRATPETPRCR